MTDTVQTPPPELVIVFRYLMLSYMSPEGVKVLVPRRGHRAILRDTLTDAVIPLSQASVRLEVDGDPAPPARTTIVPNGLLVPLEKPLQSPVPIPAHATYLDSVHVNTELNALVELPGGTVTAFPSEAFPEQAHLKVKFVFGELNQFESLVTDTTVYQGPLPAGRKRELVIRSPRRTLRVDVTGGGRFELRNEDEKFGPTPNMQTYHNTELEDILRLINETVQISCDVFACPAFYCGDADSVWKEE